MMTDFASLDELKAQCPVPAAGIIQDAGSHYNVMLELMPVGGVKRTLNGTLPKTPEVDRFATEHNWRRM